MKGIVKVGGFEFALDLLVDESLVVAHGFKVIRHTDCDY